jgi:hypothetical protein
VFSIGSSTRDTLHALTTDDLSQNWYVGLGLPSVVGQFVGCICNYLKPLFGLVKKSHHLGSDFWALCWDHCLIGQVLDWGWA